MKKTILSLLLLLSLLLVSCHELTSEPMPSLSTSAQTNAQPPIQTAPPLSIPGNFTPPKPPEGVVLINSGKGDYFFYAVNSYSELFSALKDPNNATNKRIQADKDSTNSLYRVTLDYYFSGKLPLLVPQQNGENMVLEHATIFSYSTFNMPCVGYVILSENGRLYMEVSFPTFITDESIQNVTTALELQNIIAPTYATPDNKAEFHNVYEKDVILAGEKTARVLVRESINNTDRKEMVLLYVDGVLIYLQGSPKIFSEAFWASFSLGEYIPQ
jgi:hypothetical protein